MYALSTRRNVVMSKGVLHQVWHSADWWRPVKTTEIASSMHDHAVETFVALPWSVVKL